MTRLKYCIFNAFILTTLWLAGVTAAHAQCATFDDDIITQQLTADEAATRCLLGTRAESIISSQSNLLDRRRTESIDLQVTQGADGTNLEGFAGPIWVALSGRWSEFEDADLDFGIATVGGDILTGPNAIFGVMLQNDFAFQDGPSGNSFDATGYMAGIYGILIGENLTFDARLMGGQARNDITGGGNRADNVDSTRWLAAFQVSGENQFDDGRTLIPHLAVSWFEDDMDAYTLGVTPVASQKVSYGQANVGGTLRMPIMIGGNDGSFSIGASGIYGFGDAAGDEVPEDLRAKLDLGLDVYRANAWAVSGRVTADGLGLDDYEAYGIDLGVTLWF